MPSPDNHIWTEDDFYRLADNLHEQAPDLVTAFGLVTSLGYNSDLERYSITVSYEEGGYTEINCLIDFGGGTPFPYDIHQYSTYVTNEGQIGGFDKRENLQLTYA